MVQQKKRFLSINKCLTTITCCIRRYRTHIESYGNNSHIGFVPHNEMSSTPPPPPPPPPPPSSYLYTCIIYIFYNIYKCSIVAVLWSVVSLRTVFSDGRHVHVYILNSCMVVMHCKRAMTLWSYIYPFQYVHFMLLNTGF